MELKEHIKIIKSAKWFIIVLALLVGLVSCFLGSRRPVNYKTVVSFDVIMINQNSSPDNESSLYYDLKGAEIFTQTATSWLRTPATIEEIYKDAGIGYEIDDLDIFTNRFKASLDSAQSFTISFNDVSRVNAEKVGSSLGKIMAKKTQEVYKTSDKQPIFELKASAPTIAKNQLNIYIITVMGLITGIVFAVILVYLRKYFKE